MDMNKALMRGAVKVIAMYTGLGLKLYTGEDLETIADSKTSRPKESVGVRVPPANSDKHMISEKQLKLLSILRQKVYKTDDEYRAVLAQFKVKSSKDLTNLQASKLIDALNKKIERGEPEITVEQVQSAFMEKSGEEDLDLAEFVGWMRDTLKISEVDPSKLRQDQLKTLMNKLT
jgi:hypothetical protein